MNIGNFKYRLKELLVSLCLKCKFALSCIKSNKSKISNESSNKILYVINLYGPILATVLSLFSFVIFQFSDTKLAVYCENQLLALNADEYVYQESMNKINDLFSDEIFTELNINLLPCYQLTVSKKQVDDVNDIEKNLLSIFNGKIIRGYGLYVDGELLACTKNEGELEEILDSILIKSKNENPDAIDVSFFNDVNIQGGIYPAALEQTSDNLYDALTYVKEETFKHIIQTGESVDFISQAYDIPQEDIFKQNPQLLPGESLNNGTSLQLSKKSKVLNVKITKEEVYNTNLNFETKVVIDTNDYLNSIKIIQNGIDGVQERKDKVSFVDGEEISRENIYVNTITPATQQLISKGVKEQPEQQTIEAFSGKFIWPVPFTKNISSYFGIRWKKLHKGIDIASYGINGQNIIASDAGTIIQASDKKNGYGNCVIIQHNEKYSTLYGHCSAILVSTGDKVAQGQVIATVGSTGNSTGPHLHFEIRENNIATDPLSLVVR